MRDITDLMNAYRECSRHLWNAYFSGKENSGASLDTFSQIQPLLFEGIVDNDLNYDGDQDPEALPPPTLKVVPSLRAEILIEALHKPGEAHYWGEVKDMFVGPDEIELDFIDYFDWSQWPIREFQYYLCKIVRFPSHPQYEGRQSLIAALSGRVFHDDSK